MSITMSAIHTGSISKQDFCNALNILRMRNPKSEVIPLALCRVNILMEFAFLHTLLGTVCSLFEETTTLIVIGNMDSVSRKDEFLSNLSYVIEQYLTAICGNYPQTADNSNSDAVTSIDNNKSSYSEDVESAISCSASLPASPWSETSDDLDLCSEYASIIESVFTRERETTKPLSTPTSTKKPRTAQNRPLSEGAIQNLTKNESEKGVLNRFIGRFLTHSIVFIGRGKDYSPRLPYRTA